MAVQEITKSDEKRVGGNVSAFVVVEVGDKLILALNTPKTEDKFKVIEGGKPAPQN